MFDKKRLIDYLSYLHKKKEIQCYAIYQQNLVETGIITASEIDEILEKGIDESISVKTLILLSTALNSTKDFFDENDDKINLENYFPQNVINNVLASVEKRAGYPYDFIILAELKENEYLITVKPNEIQRLKSDGIIIWVQGIQRQSIQVEVGRTGLVSRIDYSSKRAKEIGELIAKGEFHPNTLRWHIIDNGVNKYSIRQQNGNRILTLLSGNIAEIDGQHRDRALEFAYQITPKIDITFPVIVTVGNKESAQDIIIQEEKREPIKTLDSMTLADSKAPVILNHFTQQVRRNRTNKIGVNPSMSALSEQRKLINSKSFSGIGGTSYLIDRDLFITAIKHIYFDTTLVRVNATSTGTYIAQFLITFFNVVFKSSVFDKISEDIERYRYILHPDTLFYYIKLANVLEKSGYEITDNLCENIIDCIYLNDRKIFTPIQAEKTAANIVIDLSYYSE